MSPISKTIADAAIAKYQRQLLRAAIPSFGVYLAVVVPLMVLFVIFLDRVPHRYRSALGLALMIVVTLVVQIPLRSFRRNVRELSVANGLICPACHAPLGDSYATLKRTGKCRHCCAQVIDAV